MDLQCRLLRSLTQQASATLVSRQSATMNVKSADARG
jgi:hypothetical protein